MNLDTAMLFHLLGIYTNPPTLVPPFLLTLKNSPKDIAGSDITNYCLMHDALSDIGG